MSIDARLYYATLSSEPILVEVTGGEYVWTMDSYLSRHISSYTGIFIALAPIADIADIAAERAIENKAKAGEPTNE